MAAFPLPEQPCSTDYDLVRGGVRPALDLQVICTGTLGGQVHLLAVGTFISRTVSLNTD